MSGEPVKWRIARWRGQIAELAAAIGQLGQSGLDRATAQLLIAQARRIGKSAELESLMDPTVASGCSGTKEGRQGASAAPMISDEPACVLRIASSRGPVGHDRRSARWQQRLEASPKLMTAHRSIPKVVEENNRKLREERRKRADDARKKLEATQPPTTAVK